MWGGERQLPLVAAAAAALTRGSMAELRNGPTSTAPAAASHRKVPVNAPPLRPVMGVCPGTTTPRSSSA